MTTPMPEDADYCNEQVAKKVAYEHAMFTFLYGELRSRFQETATFQPGDVTYLGTGGEPSDGELRETFALLESYLLHTRVLHDFFYKAPSRDDVVAAHFVPGWEGLRPPLDAYLGDPDRKKRLDKALAHITLARVGYDSHDKKWNVDAIRDAIENAMATFLTNLPPERRLWFGAG